MINPDVIDAGSVKDFIAKVKAAPGKYNYASTGNGTGTHLAFAEFVHKAGLDMVHVPYKGGPEAIQGVLAGDTCCIFNQVQTALPQWRAGKVRLLGVTTKKRVPRDRRRADDRRGRRARLRELHLVRHLRTEGPRSGDRRAR